MISNKLKFVLALIIFVSTWSFLLPLYSRYDAPIESSSSARKDDITKGTEVNNKDVKEEEAPLYKYASRALETKLGLHRNDVKDLMMRSTQDPDKSLTVLTDSIKMDIQKSIQDNTIKLNGAMIGKVQEFTSITNTIKEVSSIPNLERYDNTTDQFKCNIKKTNVVKDLVSLAKKGNNRIPERGQNTPNVFSKLEDGILTFTTCNSPKKVYYTGKWYDYTQPVKITTEYVYAKCANTLNSFVQNIKNQTLYNIAKENFEKKKKGLGAEEKKLNVIVIMQDSISRAQFHRDYVNTFKILKELSDDVASPSHVIDFEQVHALGTNSLPNKCFFWGDFCWEKSCTHKWKENETRVKEMFEASGSKWDNQTPNKTMALLQDWLWKSFSSENGYVMMYGEEEYGKGRVGKSYGSHSILNFFEEVPADEKNGIPALFPSDIFRQNWKEAEFKIGHDCQSTCPAKINGATSISSCNGHKLSFNLAFDYIQQFWKNYDGVGRFAGYMLNSAHDSNPNSIACIDYGISVFIKDLKDNNVLDDTVVVLVSDHGMKYGNFFKTDTGKQENLLPHIISLFPRKLLDANPKMKKAIQSNQKKLVTHHDLHFTLKHLVDWPEVKNYQTGNTYSLSLFNEEPIPTRDCETCGVPANWCLCYLWHAVNISTPRMVELAHYAVESLNRFVLNGTTICNRLTLKSVTSIDMAEFSTTTVATYRIIFDVNANREMKFRGTVVEKDGQFWMDQWDVEQISPWGKFVKCNPNNHKPPIEPQFCYCKK